MPEAEHLFQGHEDMLSEHIARCIDEAIAMQPHI